MTRQEIAMLEAARTACLAALQAVESVIARDDADAARPEGDPAWDTFDTTPPSTGAGNGRKEKQKR